MDIITFILRFIRYVVNWPLYAFNRIMPITYYFWEGGKMYVAPHNRCSLTDVFIFRHYDAPLPWKEIRTVTDIGANTGAFTVFAHAKSPEAHIVAIEPDPENFAMLVRNAPKDTKCIRAAVGGREGSVVLHTGRSPGEHSIHGEGPGITVDMITLHRFLPCDLLKVDCEGAEYDIFRSLSDEQLRTVRFMFIELHRVPGETAEALQRRLESTGFRITHQNNHVIVCRRDESPRAQPPLSRA